MLKAAILVVVSLFALCAVYAWAQGRIDVRPTLTPIASSSSNGLSFAWFFDPSSRTVYVCVAGATMDCKRSAALP